MLQTRTNVKSAVPDIQLDEFGCLSLAEILECFNAPISEEHAWALIYQCLRALDNCIRDNLIRLPEQPVHPPNENHVPVDLQQHKILSVLSTNDILIQEDGIIHHLTWCDCKNHSSNRPRTRERNRYRRKGGRRPTVYSEDKVISQFGVVIYSALDSGLGSDKERHLSSGLEEIIESMTLSAGDDEGIESDQYDTEVEESHSLDHKNRYRSKIDELHPPGMVKDVTNRHFFSSNATIKFLQKCTSQLPPSSDANIHYRAVCGALVSEALEISSFINKVSKLETECDDELMNEMALQDWRRNFTQVMEDLRNGPKLRSTTFNKVPVEYELTPYELLMEDIRTQKYQLNKVDLSNYIKKTVPKNAHDVILHFIRSRPPLKPATERKLHPQRKESTPQEMLMDSIRGSRARSSLRKTKGPPVKSLRMRLGYETSRCEEDEFENEENNNDARRKVTLDPSLVQNMLNFSDDESEEEGGSVSYSRQASRDSTLDEGESVIDYAKRKQYQSIDPSKGPNQKRQIAPNRSITRTSVNYLKMTELLDDENDSSSVSGTKECTLNSTKDTLNKDHRRSSSKSRQRRNSLGVCETPARKKSDSESVASLKLEDDNQIWQQTNSNSQRVVLATQMSNMSISATSATSTSSNHSRSSTPVESILSDQLNDETSYDLNMPQMHASLHSEFLESEGWAAALQTLELTLDEVVHIRSVLTKAELENLPLEGALKDDVEKGKVCFLCMKTRFGFLRRGYKCELCKQQICAKCCTKMSIPSSHFASSPVISMDDSKTPRTGSEPNSPMSHRHNMSQLSRLGWDEKESLHSSLDPALGAKESQTSESSSLSNLAQNCREDEYTNNSAAACNNSKETSQSQSADIRGRVDNQLTTSISDRLEGPNLTVCVDCKEMILQVIRAQSTARRIKMAKSLFDEGGEIQHNEALVNADVWGEEFF